MPASQTPDRRRVVEAIFDAALDAPAGERAAVIDRACAGDAALRGEVQALLAAHERTGSLSDIVRRAAATVVAPPALAERIGPWRIVSELGRGGMGIVHLAERADGQFRRRAAIKVIAGLDHPELRRHFEAERQILAALDHPSIARLLDGGVTPDGRPYLVMEYVNGLPVDAYCDRLRLTIEERLRLFCTIARAVHHAHRNLVVHRDLKPSNILVAADGTPKLLDFGIAKILDPAVVDAAPPRTRTGVRLMTPEYASPEQVRGAATTTASDVWALGVVLHELLTGRLPFAREAQSPYALERRILEEEPPRPSSAVARDLPPGALERWSAEAAAQARRLSPDRLRRRLRGDLDRIVLMALRKEPSLRYASAAQMADDVERHLDGEPVLALRGDRWYRARKFVRRHRVETLAVAVVAASLVGGMGAALRQGAIAQRERGRAVQALAATSEALRQSEEVSRFLIDLFEAVDPNEGRGDTITARELLLRGEQRIARLDGEPVVQARLLDAIGRVNQNMGQLALAQAQLGRALALRRRALGGAHPEVATSLRHLAEAVWRGGEFDRADSLYRAALAVQRSIAGPRDTAIAQTLSDLAYLTVRRGDLAEAEALFRQALEMRRATLGPEHPLVAASLKSMGAILRRRQDIAGSEHAFREALAMRRRVLGTDHPETAISMLDMADMLWAFRRDYAAAESLYLGAIAAQRRTLGEGHPDISGSLSRLAVMHAARGDHAAAERTVREAVALRRRVFGPVHPSVAEILDNLAMVLRDAGKLREAEATSREVLRIQRRLYGDVHPFIGGSLTGLAATLHLQRRDEEAERVAREAAAIRERTMGATNPIMSATLRLLGDILARRGADGEADSVYRRALEIALMHHDGRHHDARAAHARLAMLADRRGDPEAARRHRELAGDAR